MKRRLIKILVFILAIVCLIPLTSCAKNPTIDEEGLEWNLVFVTYESAANVVYAAAEYKISYPDAKTLSLSCRAYNGNLIIRNEKNYTEYLAKYTLCEDGSSYDVTVSTKDGPVTGYAEVTKVTLHDDTIEYNLVIVVNGYTMHFKSDDPNA